MGVSPSRRCALFIFSPPHPLSYASLSSASLRLASPRFTLFQSSTLHSTTLHSNPIQSIPIHSATLHSNLIRYTPFHSAKLHSAKLHSALLRLFEQSQIMHRFFQLLSAQLHLTQAHYTLLLTVSSLMVLPLLASWLAHCIRLHFVLLELLIKQHGGAQP